MSDPAICKHGVGLIGARCIDCEQDANDSRSAPCSLVELIRAEEMEWKPQWKPCFDRIIAIIEASA